jgi:hypothetical protein
MENENTDAPEVLETQETDESQSQTQDTQEEALSHEEIVELKRKASERDELEKKNKQLYERVKKSEGTSKPKETRESSLGMKDVLYLAKADIAPEDVDEVTTYAARMGVSIAEAHNFYKPVLSVRAEERRTADATQTRGARGSAKQTGEDLLQKAERGNETPATDEGIRALAEARQARRVAAKQR